MLNRLRLTGAEVLAQVLLDSGIRVVFGIPGVSNLALFEALRRAKIRVVATTHEQGAAFMAYGIGRVTGKPGVFITIPGPGFTNALTPIAEAFTDSVPMLGIVTTAPLSNHHYQMHEIDQQRLAQAVVKATQTVQSASEISIAYHNLFDLTMRGEPGPCLLQVPGSVLWDRLGERKTLVTPTITASISIPQIESILSRITLAKRIGILVGQGVVQVAEQLKTLAECLNAPVATTGSGRGVIDEMHPLSLGFAWKAESIDAVNRIFDTCDLILALGVKFSQTGTQDFRLKINSPMIHIDASPDVLGKNYKAEIALAMDAGDFIEKILAHQNELTREPDDELMTLIQTERARCEERLNGDRSTALSIGDQIFSPLEFFQKLRQLLPPDAIVVTDAGHNERLTLQHWEVYQPRTLINPNDYESMGFAIPVASGAAIAQPERQVIVIIGDGGLVMSGLELMTAVRENIKLKVIVLNNEGFGVIKRIQESIFGASEAVDVGAPNFQALAESIHLPFQSTAEGWINALEQILEHPGPILLEVKMRYISDDQVANSRRVLKNNLKQSLQKILRLTKL